MTAVAPIRSSVPLATLAAYARALVHWQSRKRYCGRCGAPTRFDQGGHRALCSDPDCAQQYFPRTDPAIITLVTHGDRCLLGRQPSWPDKRYSMQVYTCMTVGATRTQPGKLIQVQCDDQI